MPMWRLAPVSRGSPVDCRVFRTRAKTGVLTMFVAGIAGPAVSGCRAP